MLTIRKNGGYINPPRVKRQFRDPHGDWWDKQERRNYGEPVHEDNDILGMFSPEEYTHTKPGKGALQLLTYVGAVFGLCGIVSLYYPDKSSAPREFPGGLEKELGGPNAVRVSAPKPASLVILTLHRLEWLVIRLSKRAERLVHTTLGKPTMKQIKESMANR